MIDIKKVKKLYQQGKTQSQIARMIGVTRGTIWYHLTQMGIPLRKNGWIGNRGSHHPRWKNGSRTSAQGYIHVYFPHHPRAHNNKIPLQILLMEAHLGRHLRWISKLHPNNEIVHHKNENKTDNRLDNLEVMTLAEHNKLNGRKSVFTKEERASIRKEQLNTGCTNRYLAIKYGVSDTTMSDLLRCKMKVDKPTR